MRKFPLAVLALSVSVLVGCKAVDAMDNTDAINKNLVAMKETTSGMSNTTNQLNNGTAELTRLAKVADGKADLDLSKHHYDSYLPPPDEILAGAQLVAENMDEKLLTEYLFARIENFTQIGPDATKQDAQYVGGYAPKYVAKYNLTQMVRGVILQAIAGQIPQPMVEKIIQTQFSGRGGGRPDVALQMLMLRAMFLDSFLIDKDTLRMKIKNVEMAHLAAQKIGYLKFLNGLNLGDPIAFNLSSTAFLPQVNPPQLVAPLAPQVPTDDPTYPDLVAKYNVQMDDYNRKCVHTSPAHPSCLPTTSEFSGLATYQDVKLDPTMDQRWWKKLDRAIEGYTDCNGKFHKGEVPADLLNGNSPFAREFAEIAQDALRNFPRETCPAK